MTAFRVYRRSQTRHYALCLAKHNVPLFMSHYSCLQGNHTGSDCRVAEAHRERIHLGDLLTVTDQPNLGHLIVAIMKGNIEDGRSILRIAPDLLKNPGYARGVLDKAARRDNLEMVKLLVEFGADINAPKDEL